MTITLPNAAEIDQYGVQVEPPGARAGRLSMPMIADDEAVCRVRGLETGTSAYWSRGDVDTHVLYAKQQGLVDGPSFTTYGPDVSGLHPAWLAQALRTRREQRQHLQQRGVQTTASGLVLFHSPRPPLVVTTRR